LLAKVIEGRLASIKGKIILANKTSFNFYVRLVVGRWDDDYEWDN